MDFLDLYLSKDAADLAHAVIDSQKSDEEFDIVSVLEHYGIEVETNDLIR